MSPTEEIRRTAAPGEPDATVEMTWQKVNQKKNPEEEGKEGRRKEEEAAYPCHLSHKALPLA